jgi:hypothetical protein
MKDKSTPKSGKTLVSKVYVKPTVTKHKAVSSVVGSCSCSIYVASRGGGTDYSGGCDCYYH